jgi:hypothetical protein
MGRPKGSKNKDTKEKIEKSEITKIWVDDIESQSKKEILLYCKECEGILFGGQIIHKKGCTKHGKSM